jgi:GNAT superfamily N-acetyltransferase
MIRQASPPDAGEVVDLVRQSFRPEDLALTIYGCSGIAEYLRREFAAPRNAYLVAETEGRMDGFLEMRPGPSLNYIAIDRAHRGKGIGRELLFSALAGAAGSRLTLDVFEHNTPALAWYQKLGFQNYGRTAIWRVQAVDCPPAPVYLSGLSQADTAHRVFGFSNFALSSGGRDFTIGRLGEHWFFITDRALLSDSGVLRALRTIDSSREILFRGEALPIPGEPLLWSLRMEHSLPLC